MFKDDLSFQKLAGSAPNEGLEMVWSPPQARFDLGGEVAVWVEQGRQARITPFASVSPWLVLHGGPGGRMGAAHVAPLRIAGLPWFGFDQRNSGLSEDLDSSCIDLQRYIDDALDIADSLGVDRFHILGGSWGATLALAIANYRPERVASLVLRAPFIPLRPRVDAFFEQLEEVAPAYFADHFGPGARTQTVCECFEVATPEHLLELSIAWNRLETALLTGATHWSDHKGTGLSDLQEFALVRKYRLQAHFLKHDCFLSPTDWNQLLSAAAQAAWPVTIVQGMKDVVCPPGGARMWAEMVRRTRLVELPEAGHLADSPVMMQALALEAERNHRRI